MGIDKTHQGQALLKIGLPNKHYYFPIIPNARVILLSLRAIHVSIESAFK